MVQGHRWGLLALVCVLVAIWDLSANAQSCQQVLSGFISLEPPIENLEVVWKGHTVRLSRKENVLYQLLIDNPDKTIPFGTIAMEIWGRNLEPWNSNIRVLKLQLRDKLQAVDPSFDRIFTIRSVGLRWNPPDTDALVYGDLTADSDWTRVFWRGVALPLRPQQLALLKMLVQANGRPVSRSDLVQSINRAANFNGGNLEVRRYRQVSVVLSSVRKEFTEVDPNFDMIHICPNSFVRWGKAKFEPAVQMGELIIDRWTRQIYWQGFIYSLTPLEHRLVEILAQANGRWVSVATIVRRLWSSEKQRNQSNVYALVYAVREKIKSTEPDFFNLQVKSGAIRWNRDESQSQAS